MDKKTVASRETLLEREIKIKTARNGVSGMHEMAMAQGILDIALKSAAAYYPAPVTRIKILIGEMSQAVPEALQFGFTAMAQGTVAEKAVLEIEVVPLRAGCQRCGHDFSVENFRFICPKCRSSEVSILSGRELSVEYLEVE